MPAASAAQSAGDEQYVDPFEQGGSDKSGNNNGSSSQDSSGQETQGSQGSGATGTDSSAQGAPATPAPTQAPATALARTGIDLRVPLAVGVVLLLGGALLLRWSRPASD